MSKETLSIEVKLPQPGDEAFEQLVEQIAEAAYRKVAARLNEPDDSASPDLERPALT